MNQLTTHSAVLQWSPVLTAEGDFYELRYNSVSEADTVTRRILPGDSSSVRLIDLQPDTVYTASLQPESNQRPFNALSVTFTTLPGEMGLKRSKIIIFFILFNINITIYLTIIY